MLMSACAGPSERTAECSHSTARAKRGRPGAELYLSPHGNSRFGSNVPDLRPNTRRVAHEKSGRNKGVIVPVESKLLHSAVVGLAPPGPFSVRVSCAGGPPQSRASDEAIVENHSVTVRSPSVDLQRVEPYGAAASPRSRCTGSTELCSLCEKAASGAPQPFPTRWHLSAAGGG